MGSSSSDVPTTNTNNINDNNSDTGAIDASVGGLVWVRRRNGSWWPGQIVSLDEISEQSLVSPKSGTPVRLLGRLGASVDWYNLEKSKRVKAFRCAEYAECIEKAKASAASGNRKAVKYARREDAILHALEIEKAQPAKDQVDIFHRTDNSGEEHSISARESPSMSLSGKGDRDATEESDSEGVAKSDTESGHDSGLDYVPGSDLDSDADFAQELSESGTSFEESNHIGASKVQFVQGKRRRTPNDSEDDGTEGIKRMRGLEDLGMNIGDPNTGNCMSNVSPANGCKGSNSSVRRKRSQVGNAHEFLKRKNRRRPLTKVMESTAMVPAPVTCDQLPSSSGSPLEGLSDSKISGIESNDSRKNFCMVLNNNSDSNGGVSSENGASLNPIEHGHDALHTNCKVKKEKDISEIAGLAENDSSDKLFDVPFLAEEKCSTGFSPEFVPSSTGMHHAGALGRQSSHSSQLEAASLKIEKLDECGSTIAEAAHANSINERMEKGTSKWQLKGKRNSRHIGKNRKQDSRKYMEMDEEPNTYLAGIGQLDGFDQGSDQKVNCDGSSSALVSNNGNLQIKSRSLVEDQVDGIWDWNNSFSNRESNVRGITKDASLPPQRLLPYRQSRLTVNSKYQTSDLPARNFCSSTRLFDVKLEVKASCRPQHVPLVSLTSKLNGKAIVGHPLEVELLNDGYCDGLINSSEHDPSNEALLVAPELGSPLMGNSGAVRNSAKHVTARSRFSSRKSRKLRRSGFWSKKIRKLSSLTSGKREDCIPAVEKPKGPAVACVPLKLAFSRISEALSGSARQTHHP